MTQESTEFATVEEAAVMSGVSSITIRRAIRNKELRYKAERGLTKLLLIADVQAWRNRRTELRRIEPSE